MRRFNKTILVLFIFHPDLVYLKEQLHAQKIRLQKGKISPFNRGNKASARFKKKTNWKKRIAPFWRYLMPFSYQQFLMR